MPNSELKVTLTGNGVTVVFNDYGSGTPLWILRNTSRLLSKLGTRHTATPRQTAHGVQDGLSHDDARTLLFEGELHAASQADRKIKERLLRRCVGLPADQSFEGDDGYILAVFEDEDGEEYQCYVKVVDYPSFDIIDNTDPTMRSVDMVLFAKDPTLYSTELTEFEGPESFTGTTFQIQDGDLPTIQDGDLPTIQDMTIVSFTATNDGTTGTPPLITIHGPTSNPVVGNMTSGKTMDFSNSGGLTLLEGERLEIDVAALSCTKFDVSDVETDALGYRTEDSEWIFIDPGDNEMTLFDDTLTDLEAQLEVEFRAAWK